MSRPTRPFLPTFLLSIILCVPNDPKASQTVEPSESGADAADSRAGGAPARRVCGGCCGSGGIHLFRACSLKRGELDGRFGRPPVRRRDEAESRASVEVFRI